MTDKLDRFYAALKEGLTVADFLSRYEAIFDHVHSSGHTKDYRLAKGLMKKLSDEVTPVARFVKLHARSDDQIRFAMDNGYPDCLLHENGGGELGIEVTIAQARERLHLMTELNKTGTGRGFIGLNDDASSDCFADAMLDERRAYSTEEAIACIEQALALVAEKKKLHKGNMLLIETPLGTLPSKRWYENSSRFSRVVDELHFDAIFLTGRGDDGDMCLQVK